MATTTFKYKAIDAQGRVVRGAIDAACVNDLELRLAQRGLDMINFRASNKRLVKLAGTRITRQEIINFTFHLQQLVGAGVSILDALRDLRETITDPRLREVVAEMVTTIEGGRKFSEVLQAFPEIFTTVYCSMIRVGEESGQLARILTDLTEMLRWQDELIAQARRAMLYPAITGVIVLPAVVALLALLVPQLTDLLAITGGEMPWHTEVLLIASDFFVAYWYMVLIAPFALAASIKGLAATSSSCRHMIDSFALRVWVLGPIIYKIKIARFANYFALMYASGITVLDSIALSRKVVGNTVLAAALAEVHGRISDGGRISLSFARSGLFPALVVRMLTIGENTGAMDKALLNVSYFYERQAKEAIDELATLLGPTLVLVIAALLGWIMVAILPPIYTAVISLDF